jgi:hypothetical protein
VSRVETLIAALPSEGVLINVGSKPFVVPARPQEVRVASENMDFQECFVTHLKLPGEARVNAMPRGASKPQDLTVNLEGGSMEAARLQLAAFTGVRFSMAARQFNSPSGKSMFNPVEVSLLDEVGGRLLNVMRQAEIDFECLRGYVDEPSNSTPTVDPAISSHEPGTTPSH